MLQLLYFGKCSGQLGPKMVNMEVGDNWKGAGFGPLPYGGSRYSVIVSFNAPMSGTALNASPRNLGLNLALAPFSFFISAVTNSNSQSS